MLFLHFLSIFHPLIGAAERRDHRSARRPARRSPSASAPAAARRARVRASAAVFGAAIQAKTRQPELRQDIERDQWLGFALTEACFFYGLVGGFIAAFLF